MMGAGFAKVGDIMNERIRQALFALQDPGYKSFQCALMPTVDPSTVIGVRTPALRAMAKQLKADKEISPFLSSLPHKYYEENNLHAFLIESIADFDGCITALNRFLPFVDNWATCDMMRPKVLKKEPDRLLREIEVWIASEYTYTVRFGIGMLMAHFLDDGFDENYPKMVSMIQSEEYYVNMMIAWYFATALAKQWDGVICYLKEEQLPLWVHNKTIQKATESLRISEERKQYLRSLRRR